MTLADAKRIRGTRQSMGRIQRFLAWSLRLSCAVALFAAHGAALAAVTIAGTRVVYPAGQREVAVKLHNAGTQPALVQTWVDAGDPKESPDTSSAPFLVSPPVVRIEPGQGQTLRLVHSGAPPTEPSQGGQREAVYWLNVLEIPPAADPAQTAQNQLQLAFRTRIKIFLRPAGLAGDPDEAARGLQWRVHRGGDGDWTLECTNPAAYHVSFGRVALSASGREYRFDSAGMLAPRDRLRLPLSSLQQQPPAGTEVRYSYINDFGGRSELSGRIVE